MRPTVVIIAGDPGSGKTTVCRSLTASLKAQGRAVEGLITVPRFINGKKVGLDMQAVYTGRCLELARFEPGYPGRRARLHFHDSSLMWGALVLQTAIPSDVLVIDELGPLELLRGGGWVNAVDILRTQNYRYAVVTVRPELVPDLRDRLVGIKTLVRKVSVRRQAHLLEEMKLRLGISAG
jgi:nucleoside-triphosphatase THEP1